MTFSITKTTIAKAFLLVVAVIYVIFARNNVVSDLLWLSNNKLGGTLISKALIIGVLMLTCSAYFLFFYSQKIFTSQFFGFFLIWTIIVTVNLCFNTDYVNVYYINYYKDNVLMGAINYSLQQVFIHLFLFIFFYSVFKYYGDSLQTLFTYIVVGWYVIIALAYSENFLAFGALAVAGHSNLLGTSYVLLYSLPLALCLKKKHLKWFCVILGAIVVLSSIKRGGIIGYAFAMMTYYFVKNYYIKRSKHFYRNLIIFAILFISGVILYGILVKDSIIDVIIARIGSMSEDKGSGRLTVLIYMIKYIPELTLGQILVGSGYLASTLVSPIGHAAHNEFVEVFYNYGLIGLIVYIWFWVLVLMKLRYFIKQKSEYAAPFAAGVALLVVLSMISIIIIYPFFAWYAIIIGVFDGMTYYKKENYINNINNENRNFNIS